MDTKTYNVSFQITVPSYMQWDKEESYGENSYNVIDPGIDEPYVRVPADASIELVVNLEDGFYIHNSKAMFHRKDGDWYYWEGGKWLLSSHVDKSIADMIEKVKGLD
jgi:hypothetical protein